MWAARQPLISVVALRALGCAVFRAAVHGGRFAITGTDRCDAPASRGVLYVSRMAGV